jgi:hypothetical protein
VSPTFERAGRFKSDFSKLTPEEQNRLLEKVRDQFVPALGTGDFPAGLRVKGVQGASGVYEMTWAPNGRVTFMYGDEQIPGEIHIVWRRVGGHEIFGTP